MHKEQVVGLAVRLFALFLGIYVLRYGSGLIPYLADSSTFKISFTFLILVVLFPVLAAILLWMFPLTIAAKLIPNIKTQEPPKSLDSTEIEVIAFSILGLWVLASALSDAFHWVTYIYIIKNSVAPRVELSPENIGNIVATVVELAIGFWLLFGAKGVIGVIRRMRHAGS